MKNWLENRTFHNGNKAGNRMEESLSNSLFKRILIPLFPPFLALIHFHLFLLLLINLTPPLYHNLAPFQKVTLHTCINKTLTLYLRNKFCVRHLVLNLVNVRRLVVELWFVHVPVTQHALEVLVTQLLYQRFVVVYLVQDRHLVQVVFLLLSGPSCLGCRLLCHVA